jgi:exosortase/archaeosortase family protein
MIFDSPKLFKYISTSLLMKRPWREFFGVFFRYALLLVFSLFNLWIFYLIFTPLTVYPVYFFLNFLFGATLQGTTVYIGSIPIEMVEACIAGAAYFLLLIFNLATPGIKIAKRGRMIYFSFLIFLAANILRIVILSVVYLSTSPFFDITHKFFWYFVSVVLVISIWFYQVKIYRIKEIPFYSDLKLLYRLIKRKK